MRKLLLGLAVCGLLAASALSTQAQEPTPLSLQTAYQLPPAPAGTPTPIESNTAAPAKVPAPVVIQNAQPVIPMIELYNRVEYEDTKHMHPCAVPKIVRVLDTRRVYRNPCATCPPVRRYVFIKIMVPPYPCSRVKVRKHGSKIKYYYGKYDIEIESKRGIVNVEYDE